MAVCTKVNTMVFASGEVVSTLECEGCIPIVIPYRIENAALLGMDIHTQQCATMRSWMSPVQICPDCGAYLHLTPGSSRCFNIKCTKHRAHIFLHQLALLGITPSSDLMLVLQGRLTTNHAYDLIDLAREAPALGFLELCGLDQALKFMSTNTFLRLLKLDGLYDGVIDSLDLKYPTASQLLKAVFCGDLITLASSPEIKDADALRAAVVATTVNFEFCKRYLEYAA